MSGYTPSPAFEQAAAFVRDPSNLTKKPSNETMLELYGIFKLLTIAYEPRDSSGKPISRPSFFSPLERAKWDAWKAAGETWNSKPAEAEGRYIAIAESFGWSGVTDATNIKLASARQPSPTAEELLARDSDDDKPQARADGFGTRVSTMQAEEQKGVKTLHDVAINGDAETLESYLESNPNTDINALDEYGFTPLHLSCDRGNISTVRFLLSRGADASIKDGEGLTAVDLAEEANHSDIVTLLRDNTKSD